MAEKILIPSEMLEPIIQKTIREIMEHFALGMWSYDEMLTRINSLGHFVSNCGAVHCGIAINEPLNMILDYKEKPEELRKLLKRIIDEHYEKN